MWIVRLALRRPYTFVVMAVLMAVLGGIAIVNTPKDIFPYINLPVASVVWSYSGLSPQEMADRVVTISERAMTTTVNDIEHMESTSYNGVAVIRMFFQPGVKTEMAIAQMTAISQTILRPLPPGIFPPNIVKYDASSVPILQLSIASDALGEAQLYDYGQNFIRTQLATVQGASVPLPFGGKPRAIMVDLDPDALFAKRLSATDVSAAINLQSLILPAGTAKVGDREYFVRMNSSPDTVAGLNELPIKTVNGATVYVKDVAQVRDGNVVQNNIVRTDGRRAALLTILKNGAASTLDIVQSVKDVLPRIMAGLPKEIKLTELFDQSLFVRAAINDVVREGVMAALLTGLMILLFLGSWRSTLIVCVSIPLSILTSLVLLSALGQTINVMTLGGMALAVGILVDDATVAIENIHRNLAMKKPLTRGILDGTEQIAVPALVSTLAICIVFVPVLLLTGAASFLFTPMAMAVVFAMLASYLLSRTLVPTMVHYMLPSEVELYQEGEEGHTASTKGVFWRIHHGFHRQFERLRSGYRRALDWSLNHRGVVLILFVVYFAGSLQLMFLVGRDFFPYVDSGQMRLHVRAPEGTRIEETERIFGAVEQAIRRIIPADELRTILDNIGLPTGGFNLAFGDSATIGPFDGEILISLNPEKHAPTQEYERILREELPRRFPEETFFFQAANITNQILNFGIPSPIDVQVTGRNLSANYEIAREIERRAKNIPGAVDVHLRQEMHSPTVLLDVDRTKAGQIGLTQRDVANSMLISLSSSGQVSPNQWLNPANGVSYQITVQTPQYRVDSFDALQQTPITGTGNPAPQLLENLVRLRRSTTMSIINHYNVQPVFDVYANVDRRDLGGVANDVYRVIRDITPKLPQGTFIRVRGQVETMETSFVRLGLGLLFAILLVYLLMVVNFQSWLDPFIILMAVPGALSGILWMLFLTETTFSVPSLMGCIMSIGVATANSILLVVFANDLRREELAGARESALSAGYIRLRPVLMTALAMIIGMLPMAFGLGEGGEQNSPLGRAVIGGLIMATATTLFFVPVVYSYLRNKPPVDKDRQFEEESHAGESRPQLG
ncbi:MAG TPA: efflux RND transporter permease subunit [Acidobacteriota bacterium]|nr:efflux RND transporter permease subunit [Acidobacteriota bacterium]